MNMTYSNFIVVYDNYTVPTYSPSFRPTSVDDDGVYLKHLVLTIAFSILVPVICIALCVIYRPLSKCPSD